MTPSQLTRAMNWIAMPLALMLLAMVAYHIYQRHFMQQQIGQNYQFDDLPTLNKAPVTADINEIIAKHVFGLEPESPEPTSVVVKTESAKVVPKTRLNIKLTGVIDSDLPENGIAMLEVDRGRTLVVAVGEKIGKTDAILHQVLPGEVLLDRNGTIESVKMARKTLSLAKLDTSLLDTLPQAYSGQALEQSYQGKTGFSTPPNNLDGQEAPVYLGTQSKTSSAVSGEIKRYTNPDTETRSTNSKLPIPRVLRKSDPSPRG